MRVTGIAMAALVGLLALGCGSDKRKSALSANASAATTSATSTTSTPGTTSTTSGAPGTTSTTVGAPGTTSTLSGSLGTTSTTSTPSVPITTTSTTSTSSNVGSRFWYENDAFGNPFKTHNANEAALARQVLDLVNAERTARGLNALLPDAEAERAAKVHCEDMEGRSYFSHFTPEGWGPRDRLQMTGASGYVYYGENLQSGQSTAAGAMQGWMSSPGHRAAILDSRYTHLGVGVEEGRPYWAQIFLQR